MKKEAVKVVNITSVVSCRCVPQMNHARGRQSRGLKSGSLLKLVQGLELNLHVFT